MSQARGLASWTKNATCCRRIAARPTIKSDCDFDAFHPIYFIGGDTDFPTQPTIDTYLEAFAFFEKHSPNTLKTIHIKGRFEEIPATIVEHLDLFLYQPGH